MTTEKPKPDERKPAITPATQPQEKKQPTTKEPKPPIDPAHGGWRR